MGKPFLTLVRERKTTHDFLPKPVPKSKMDQILEAGRWAPSFLNFQPWEFVVVKKRSSIEKILGAANFGFYHPEQAPLNPPIIVVLVLRKEGWGGELGYPNWDKPGIFEAYLSMAMPAYSMVLEAQDLGLASCLLSVRESEVLKLIGGAATDMVPLIICLGYEKPGRKAARRERKPISQIVSYEHSRGKR